VADPISSAALRMRLGGLGGAYGGAGAPGGVGDAGRVVVPVVGPGRGAEGPSFGDTLKQFVSGVSDAQDAAGDLRDKFLRGDAVELHQVMAAGEEASLSLELMVELRNKVTEAYRQLISIQS
jgi:flagellar hook-basal body complex protein FliE